MPYDDLRKYIATVINGDGAANDRAEAEKRYGGQVWTTEELQRDFTVHQFCAPFVVVTRKADGAAGVLTFQHMPRFYFDFVVTQTGGKH